MEHGQNQTGGRGNQLSDLAFDFVNTFKLEVGWNCFAYFFIDFVVLFGTS